MVTSGNDIDNTNDDTSDEIGVETIAFPFTMSPPEFGEDLSPVGIEDIDGTVLFLNEFVPNDDNAVVLKGFAEELVHLVTEGTMVESGIFDGNAALPSAELAGFHYYIFNDDLTVYSDAALVLL